MTSVWTTLALAAAALALAAVTLHIVLADREAAPVRLACPLTMEEGIEHPGMVWVPAGTFEMGGDVYPEEGPRRTINVDGFWMDRTEVTNADFAAFVQATGYVTVAERADDPGAAVFVMPSGNADLSTVASWWSYVKGANWRRPGGEGTSIDGRENFPVVAIAYEDAEAYAKWKGRALPTEAQWEWAARAGAPRSADHPQPKDANTWQGVFPLINSAADGFEGLSPVGCFKANVFGLHDMIGNAWEWTADFYPGRTPEAHVIKGGSYLCAPNYCLRYRPEARQPQEADLGTNHVGFRTVTTPPPS